MSLTNLRDWPEDARLENGNYMVVCPRCGEQFMGHKRRALCKVCDQWIRGVTPKSESQS